MNSITTFFALDLTGRGAQKRKGRKNSRAGLTSTTPTPQTAEEAQDEVAAKPTEPSLEKESRTEPSPAAQEVAEVTISTIHPCYMKQVFASRSQFFFFKLAFSNQRFFMVAR